MLEVVFESGSVVNRLTPLVGQVFDDEIKSRLATFDSKFEQTFGLRQKGYTDFEIDFAKATFSNLLGGVTYMHGSSLVKSKHTAADETVTYFEAPLYTAVPSRSFFPRGFLWDEGFHNLLIGAWDTTISLDIIAHWLDLMNAEGWIPREQILGSEARARVPSQFVVQHNEVANPPAMFFPLRRLVNAFSHDTDARAKAVFKAMFGRLKVWYNWYNSSQAGSEFSTYRWRGRDANAKTQLNPLTLASGLDDYPRASHPTDAEYHLDLRCWMALASRVMADLAAALGEDGQVYESTYALLSDNSQLDKLHWSETAGRYADFGLHTDGVKLVRPQPAVPPRPGQPPPPPPR
jgi:mannosyl-oligosaccharide glucosidase